MDVTNPGLINVASEVYGNPNPNGGSSLLVPEQEDVLIPAADQGFAPASNGVASSVFPTPSEVTIAGSVPLTPVLSSTTPDAPNVIVDDQVIGQGVWLPNDPLDPAAGKHFVPPAEFVVVGPSDSFQTNLSEATEVVLTVAGVFDADTLGAPSASTLRYLLTMDPPALTSYPVSLLGREVVFTDDTTTAADAGATRIITGYNTNYIVIDRNDVDDPPFASLTEPVVGDTLIVSIERLGSEKVDTQGSPTSNVNIFPPPPTFVPNPPQNLDDLGDVNVTTGPQPGSPVITSGVRVPAAVTVEVANQSTSVGLPTNVFV